MQLKGTWHIDESDHIKKPDVCHMNQRQMMRMTDVGEDGLRADAQTGSQRIGVRQSIELSLRDEWLDMLAMAVARKMSEDEPVGADIKPYERFGQSDEPSVDDCSRSPCRVKQYDAPFGINLKPCMFLEMSADVTALAIDESGFHADAFSQSVVEFAIALAYSTALCPDEVGSAYVGESVKADIGTNPEIETLGTFVT